MLHATKLSHLQVPSSTAVGNVLPGHPGPIARSMPPRYAYLALLVVTVVAGGSVVGANDYNVTPVPFSDMTLTDSFWAPRLATNRAVTVDHNLREMEKQGSIGGFRVLAGDKSEKYHGYMWGDSDVYKTIEGACYILKTNPDPVLDKKLENIISQIERAPAANGFIFPYLQITEPDYVQFSRETAGTCESYSMGHLLDAASEYFQMTGRKNFLEVAQRAADLMVKVNREGKLLQVSGHPEVEIGLVKLYRATGKQEYLDLAQRLVEGCRTNLTMWSNGKPAMAHDDVLGHAVAVMYLFAGATDVGVLKDDKALVDQLARKWDRMVGRKMYITGGVGHSKHHEGFADDYDLPIDQYAYCETCSAIADVLWSSRMFRAKGDSKYYDVVERVLYNNLAAGAGMSGDRFFYSNPLVSDGKPARWAWHPCPCCPVNLVRFWPRLSEYIYAVGAGDLYVNLFASSEGVASVAGTSVKLTQKTQYPWDGNVRLEIAPQQPVEFALRVRIPGWAEGRPLPSDLYRYVATTTGKVILKVNGEAVEVVKESGYAVIRREWRAGDRIELELPMPVQMVVGNDKVAALTGLVAVERGPLVYCAEGVDNTGKLAGLIVPPATVLQVAKKPDLLNGVCVITGEGLWQAAGAEPVSGAFTLVPYYSWNHRGQGEMRVWFAAAAPKTP